MLPLRLRLILRVRAARLFSTSAATRQVIRNGSFRRHARRNQVAGQGYDYNDTMSLNRGSSIITINHPIATTILNEPTIIVERQLELMNVFLGYEQANKYAIMDAMGNKIGYMMERDFSVGKAIMRQFYRLHRPFIVDVFDNWGNILMSIRRPFSFINSHIKAIIPSQVTQVIRNGKDVTQDLNVLEDNGTMVGETIQRWHVWRRKYDLFQKDPNASDDEVLNQFGEINAPFLSFEFPVLDQSGKIMGGVDRNWVGLGREFFTDTGVYIIRFDAQRSYMNNDGTMIYPPEIMSNEIMNFDQRAVLLANAVSIDFDYFSRHSNHGGFVSFGSYE